MAMRGQASALGMVIYEADSAEYDDLNPADNVGITESYVDGPYGPVAARVFYHERDAGNTFGIEPMAYRTTQMVLSPDGADNPGGETGLVNRFPFTDNGIQPWEDFNLRGAAPLIPKRHVYGSYGDVGNTDSYSTFYAQAIAQGAQDQQTAEEQWALMSQVF